MRSSREYRLNRLDQWIADRFRKYYTSEVEAEIMQSFRQGFANCSNPIFEELFFKGPYIAFTKQHQMKEARKYFSQAYHGLETMVDLADSDPEGVADSAVAALRKIERFVNQVGERIDETFPEDLSEEDINKIFVEVFRGPIGFAQFAVEYLNALRPAFKFQLENGEMSQIEYDFHTTLSDIRKKQMPYLMSKLFSDL